MPFTIDKQPNTPIVVFTQVAETDAVKELPDATAQLNAFLDRQPEPVFLVIDARRVSLGLDDLLQAASGAARGEKPVLHHPRIRENIVVTTDSVIALAVKGLRSATFGSARVSVFNTVEQALDYCHEQLGQGGDWATRAS